MVAVVLVAVVVVPLETTFCVHSVGFSSYMTRTNLPIGSLVHPLGLLTLLTKNCKKRQNYVCMYTNKGSSRRPEKSRKGLCFHWVPKGGGDGNDGGGGSDGRSGSGSSSSGRVLVFIL